MSILRGISKHLKSFTQPAISCYYSTNEASADADIDEMANSQNKNRIVWIDMEMTGLHIEKDRILELACLITDENLNIVSDEFHVVLNQPDSIINSMDDRCTRVHGQNGLIEASKKSMLNEETIDKNLLDFMSKYVPKGKCPMAGNSVYMDRLFMRKYLPVANDYMHYRIIDVSSIKEVVKRWKPDIFEAAPIKELNHKALDDIKESIRELDFYRKMVFNASTN